MSRLSIYVLRWGPAFGIMTVIFIASSLPGSDLPQWGIFDFLIKKGGHMLGYFLLAAAYLHGLRRPQFGARLELSQCLICWGLATLYALTDEIHQSFVPGRHPSPLDVLLYDGGGAALAMLAGLYRARTIASRG